MAALALCAPLAACDEPRAAEGGRDSGSPAPPFAVRILGVRSCPPLPHETPSPEIGRLGVEVEVEATGTEPIAANLFYGVLEDEQHDSYRARFGACRPYLAGPPLSAGETARGFVDFEVPAQATGLAFLYAPRLQSGKSIASKPIALDR
jgi:hypothetical protein